MRRVFQFVALNPLPMHSVFQLRKAIQFQAPSSCSGQWLPLWRRQKKRHKHTTKKHQKKQKNTKKNTKKIRISGRTEEDVEEEPHRYGGGSTDWYYYRTTGQGPSSHKFAVLERGFQRYTTKNKNASPDGRIDPQSPVFFTSSFFPPFKSSFPRKILPPLKSIKITEGVYCILDGRIVFFSRSPVPMSWGRSRGARNGDIDDADLAVVSDLFRRRPLPLDPVCRVTMLPWDVLKIHRALLLLRRPCCSSWTRTNRPARAALQRTKKTDELFFVDDVEWCNSRVAKLFESRAILQKFGRRRGPHHIIRFFHYLVDMRYDV